MKLNHLIAFLLFPLIQNAQTKILFDASKAETANNADWVIDADVFTLKYNASAPFVNATGGNEALAQRFPTPAQSAITSSTIETYWTGALSAWAVDLVKLGYQVETLPYNGLITYGNTSNAQDLANYKVYIVCEPNLKFSATEKTAIINFVKFGGSLLMISDHNMSDRNNDGWDSPHIWNDLMQLNTIQVNPFGITFDYVNISPASTAVVTNATDSLTHGPGGTVTQIAFFNGASMTLNTTQNNSVVGDVFVNTPASGTTNVLVAHANYFSGKVAAIGDSSPEDDGSGDPNDNLYNGYYVDAGGNHQKLLINTVVWLAGGLNTSGIRTVNKDKIRIGPNPIKDKLFINLFNTNFKQSQFTIINLFGKTIMKNKLENTIIELDMDFLQKGIYFLQIENGERTVFKLIKE
jgi:Secretion system C-terminal sorting domain